jgi:hypothetical protein
MDELASTAPRVRNGGWGFVNRFTRGRTEMAGEEGDDSAARKLSTATSILALTYRIRHTRAHTNVNLVRESCLEAATLADEESG